jgi:hypothetical protein
MNNKKGSLPSKADQAVKLLAFIREVDISNLGWNIYYPD